MRNSSNTPGERIIPKNDKINNIKSDVSEMVNGIVTPEDFSKVYNIFKKFIENQALSSSDISILKQCFCDEKNIVARDTLIEHFLHFILDKKLINDILGEENLGHNKEDIINYIINYIIDKLDNYPFIILNEKEQKSGKYKIVFDNKLCKIFDENGTEIEIFREVKNFLFGSHIVDLLQGGNPVFVEYHNGEQAMILLDKTGGAIKNRKSSKINLNPEIHEGEIREVIRGKKIEFNPLSFGTYGAFIKNLKEKGFASFYLNRKIYLLIGHTNIQSFKNGVYMEQEGIMRYGLFLKKIKKINSYRDIIEFLK